MMSLSRGLAVLVALAIAGHASATEVTVRLPSGAQSPLDGRMILIASPLADPEPRLQVELEAPLRTPYIFGQTLNGIKPGAVVALTSTYGWPMPLKALPSGDYTVQAVLNRYETFRRADGSVVKLPPDMGEGQHWNEKPGNFYSRPVRVHLGPERRRSR